GKRFEKLSRAVNRQGLASAFRFIPYQEQKMLRYSLAIADAHWLSLNPKLEGLIVPSKFYGIAAVAKPIVVIADKNGEVARLVQQHGCGIVVAPGDVDALVGALQLLAAAPETIAEMGRRARTMLEGNFSRQKALQRWSGLLDQLDRSPTSETQPLTEPLKEPLEEEIGV